MDTLPKPPELLGRDEEWAVLSGFARAPAPHPTLAITYGRRRQGKSYLLKTLCAETGGLYFEAPEASGAELLDLLGGTLAEHLRAPARFHLPGWPEALGALARLGDDTPKLVVLDEFQRMARAAPILPSLVQGLLPPRTGRGPSNRLRLVLCGSALSFMSGLLSGQSPLRGRAGAELLVSPFGYREAARFWGLTGEPGLALNVFAVVGGTPAYRREFVGDDAPTGPDDFDPWVLRTALNPASPLFREGRYLLAEESELRDHALHHSVLAAIAAGHTTRGAIAGAIGRAASEMAHPLTILEDVGFIERRADFFGGRTSTFHIREPIVRFYHAIARPSWSGWTNRGAAAALWVRAQPTFRAQLLGRAFEEICLEFVRHHATHELGLPPIVEAGSGVVSDPGQKTQHQVDVAACTAGEPGRPRRLVAIGEAKAGQRMDLPDLERLERIRSLLQLRDGLEARDCRLLLFSAVGFEPGLKRAAKARGAHLVDLARLYG